jgi:hypothetical protein
VKNISKLFQPKTLKWGEEYLYIETPPRPRAQALPDKMSRVIFLAYDVCPAFVIVRNGSSKRWRCPRHHLFTEE